MGFRRCDCLLVALVLLWLAGAGRLHAQTLAFPGAEGAAKFASGGRGTPGNPGDVYVVTNLLDYDSDNDGSHSADSAETPIPGSLRYGILTAPPQGRTIVFAVSGTIELHDRLQFGGHSNITIAGQTAPGGGITLAKHEFNINNVNNIIVQHIRSRPGDRYPESFEPAYYPQAYDQDGIGVTGSTNVMIDHATVSWSVDEGLSVTSNSDKVTVQWSTITQALNSAGHSEMDPSHSFGSLINGGNYTYHHNFYAHNRSRHPRPQGPTLNLDWVNNVIYNPGDRYGYSETSSSGDNYNMNFVNNFGVDGPNTTASSLFNARTTASDIYAPASSSMRDANNNGVLEATIASGNNYISGTYTPSATRFPGGGNSLYEVNTHSADQAYIQVLSRAGANFYRDSHDRQMFRSVFNQLGGFIDTQSQVGGWPTLPSPPPPLDSNNDGVPDQWAIDNGFDVNTPLNTVFAPDGYSQLEKYIHSLTPYSYAPFGTTPHTIRTTFGNGADAYVSEIGGGTATSGGDGTGSTLQAGWDGAGGNLQQLILLRFDLSQMVPGSLTSARLDLTAAPGFSGNHTFKVYGLEHDAAGWDWDESTVEFNTAPALTVDNDSGTQGINTSYNAISPLDTPDLLTLGTFTANGLSDGQTVSLSNLNLAVFLNLAMYFENTDQDGLVTLLLQQTNDSNNSLASFYSSEGDALLAPRLVVEGLLAPAAPVLAGDYNDDGRVDGGDYVRWRNALAGIGTIENETESPGEIDEFDYLAWKNNYGAPFDGGGGLAGRNSAVPEPGSLVLLMVAGAFLLGLRKRGSRLR